LFEQGYQLGGYVAPEEGRTFTREQAKELEEDMARRFKGVDKAHRWAVLRFKAEMKSLGVTPKDAEFLGALAWSLEEACRAYKIPLDMVGGQRTYENVRASDRAFWMRAMLPEAKFVSSEVVEQLLPMFQSRPDVVELDTSHVPALQEEEGEQWKREEGQIKVGAITVNEWRETKGLEPVEWGDERWTAGSGSLFGGSPQGEEGGTQTVHELNTNTRMTRSVEYGSEEHRRLWGRYVRQTERFEREFRKIVVNLLERQRVSVLQRLKARSARGVDEVVSEPFDLAEWVKKFKQAVRAILREIVEEFGGEAAAEVGAGFDVLQKEVIQFLEQRAQRFAKQVNETTWQQLKESLSEGVEAGESVEELAERVEEVMDGRIESSAETIARTEVIGASNGGMLEAWQQSGVVKGKVWLAALDDRTRDSHVEAHGQEVGLYEEFVVGSARGMAPGQMGEPEEDINCRCTMTAVLE
jgi:SPP1 gp7 family putative phage head morphogenesis protein